MRTKSGEQSMSSRGQSVESNRELLANSYLADDLVVEGDKKACLAEVETQQTAVTARSVIEDESGTGQKKKKKKNKKRKAKRQGDDQAPISILVYEERPSEPLVEAEDVKSEEQLRFERMLGESKVRNPRKPVIFGKKLMQKLEKFVRRVIAL